jgi:hypothetical protein
VFGDGFYPQRRICWITAAEQVAQRRFRELHEKTKPDEAGYLPTDGVAIYADVEDTNPDDRFLDDEALRSVLDAAQQAPGDEN